MSARARHLGFTLLEVMGVVALISIVFFVALNFYTDLARASNRASDFTRDIRRASAILDRVARDLESTLLIAKPPEVDPVEFPWIFFAQTRLGGDVADQLKFITRHHDPTRTEAAETNLAVVAFFSETADDDTVSLFRWSSPRLPDRLDKDFPRDGDEGAYLLAEGLRHFGFSFVGEDGEIQPEWDSSTLLESSALPVAVQIELSLYPDEDVEREPTYYRRTVLLPVRPLDLVALADPDNPLSGSGKEDDEKKEDEEEEDGEPGECKKTLGQCIDVSKATSSSTIQQMCVGIASGNPDTPFCDEDYQGWPDECKAMVKSECRP